MTEKQKSVVRKVVLEGKSVSKAMRESGYSRATAKNPKVVTNSKGWKELMAYYLSEEKIMKVHSDQLDATDIVFNGKEKLSKPDNQARLKAVDLAWKLRGSYAAEKVILTDPLEQLTNAELATKITKLKNHLLKKRKKRKK